MKKPKPSKPLEERWSKFRVPIYNVEVEIVTTNSIKKSYSSKRRGRILKGFVKNSGGLCTHRGPEFFIFIDNYHLTTDIVAHEIFHLTHLILERAGVKFSKGNHEPFAYLSGFLTSQVFGILQGWDEDDNRRRLEEGAKDSKIDN